MTKLSFAKVGGNLVPVDDDARAVMSKIKAGREVILDIKLARHPKQHRTFFALLDKLVDNGGGGIFDSVEQALTAVKVAIGEVDPTINADTGEVVYTLRSISFESCDQTRFSDIFDRTLNVICDRWLVGTEKEALREEVLAVVEDKSMRALGKRIPTTPDAAAKNAMEAA